MKKIIFFIAIILIFTGCGHYKWISKHPDIACAVCPEQTDSIVTSDSIIKYVHAESIDTVLLPPDPDSLIIFAIAYCDSVGNVQMNEVYTSSNGNSATISISNNNLEATIICNEDSLKQIIKTYRDSINIKYRNRITVTKKIKVPVIIRAGKFYIWFTWIVIAIIVSGIFYLFIYKSVFKF